MNIQQDLFILRQLIISWIDIFLNFSFREIEMTPFGVGVIQQLAYLVDDSNVSFE